MYNIYPITPGLYFKSGAPVWLFMKNDKWHYFIKPFIRGEPKDPASCYEPTDNAMVDPTYGYTHYCYAPAGAVLPPPPVPVPTLPAGTQWTPQKGMETVSATAIVPMADYNALKEAAEANKNTAVQYTATQKENERLSAELNCHKTTLRTLQELQERLAKIRGALNGN